MLMLAGSRPGWVTVRRPSPTLPNSVHATRDRALRWSLTSATGVQRDQNAEAVSEAGSCSQSIMTWYAVWNFCAAAGGSLRDGGEKLGGALLAVLFGSNGLTSCLHNTSTLGTHPSGRQKHAWHPPRNHGRSMTHGMTMPLVPVNQIDNRDLGEGVRGREALLIVPKPFA